MNFKNYQKGLLVTTYKGREDDCAQEAWYILSQLNYREFEVEKVGLPGILILKTNFDPIKCLEDFINYSKENIWSIRYILKVIPLEIIVEADYEKIADAAEFLSEKIEENSTYRITVNNRSSPLNSKEIIFKTAERIKRKVDLTKYDYEVLIEIIGKIAGVSVLKRDQVFSLHKARERSVKEITGEDKNQ
ncbi:MAG: THUMP domain-containing protein [Thermoproteota archaeon]|jgi:Predicted RNA-binding protein, contains THUMP domain